MTLMKISEQGLNLIKQNEGCKLFAYRDTGNVVTIGYGHTKGVKMGMAITQQQANAFLKEDVAKVEKILNDLRLNFKQCQFDALCSWIYNIGEASFNRSTMAARIKTGASDEAITDQLIRWVKDNGRTLLGLMKRRVAEANMFLGYERYKIVNKQIVKV